jgi:hypothetical protein
MVNIVREKATMRIREGTDPDAPPDSYPAGFSRKIRRSIRR